MNELQQWFAPLLWIIGTITALGGFIRFCKPLWNIVQAPKEMQGQFQCFREDMDAHFIAVNTRLDKYDEDLQHLKARAESADTIQLSLLRSGIVSSYHTAMDKGEIPDNLYRTICDMFESYKKDGGNSYIETVMEQVEELYKDTQEKRRIRNSQK